MSNKTAVLNAAIRMGHDIVRQFAHQPRARAVEEVSAHILKFWDPRMRAELRRCMDGCDLEVNPILLEAVRTWPDEADTQADRDEPPGG